MPVESLPVSNSAGGGVQSAEVIDVAPAGIAQLITDLEAATPEQVTHIRRLLALEPKASEGAVTPVKAKKAAAKAPGAPVKIKKEKMVAPMPEADGSSAPTAGDYRIEASSIDEALCIARVMNETDASKDKRWTPMVYRELQCGGKRIEGSDLCTKCSKREAKYGEDPACRHHWNGRINEEPPAWAHMLGTAWAAEKGCKFNGSGAGDTQSGGGGAAAGSVADQYASDTASENGSAEEMPAAAVAAVAVKTAVADKKAEKAAAAAAKAAEKAATAAAAKAAKEAEKEAAKAAKAAEKEAAATAAKAAKLAAKAATAAADKLAKAAATAAKPATAAPKAAAAKPKTAAKPEAKKAAAAEPAVVEGELKLIDGTLYMVKNGNVFEYDELAEKAGDFVGRITGDETIDTEADEVTAAESDSD
jgi:hypothetical protein